MLDDITFTSANTPLLAPPFLFCWTRRKLAPVLTILIGRAANVYFPWPTSTYITHSPSEDSSNPTGLDDEAAPWNGWGSVGFRTQWQDLQFWPVRGRSSPVRILESLGVILEHTIHGIENVSYVLRAIGKLPVPIVNERWLILSVTIVNIVCLLSCGDGILHGNLPTQNEKRHYFRPQSH